MIGVFEKSPVRVLDEKIFDFFMGANEQVVDFHRRLNDVINHGISLCVNNRVLPKVDLSNNTISLSMPFLDSLWCSFFAMHVLHEEMRKFARKQPEAHFFDIQSVDVGKHYIFTLNQFNKILNENTELDWDKNFVSPNNLSFSEEINNYIKDVNQLYVIGVSEMMLHECSHVYYKHDSDGKSDEEIILQEREADKNACSLLMENIDSADKEYTVAYAILLNYLSMLFMCKVNSVIKDKTHPVIQDRIRFLFKDFIEPSSIDESAKISLYHLCLQVFDMFLSQRHEGLLGYDDITDVRKAFYENLNVIDKFVCN